MPRGRRNKPEIDICRVQTWRLRELSNEQLQRAERRVGPLYAIPKRQQGETKPRWLIGKFISDLLGERTTGELNPRSVKAYRERYGEDPMPTAKIKEMYRREADRIELKIWDMQQKRGCKIKGDELVARDAIRQGDHDQGVIDRLRGRRRPKIR